MRAMMRATMRASWILLTLGAGLFSLTVQNAWAQTDIARQAAQLEAKGEGTQAIELLRQAAQRTPANAPAIRAYAEFLDRHRDPGARAAYERLATALQQSGAPQNERASVALRLATLDVLENDRSAATRHLA